jgi:hypothetical protein
MAMNALIILSALIVGLLGTIFIVLSLNGKNVSQDVIDKGQEMIINSLEMPDEYKSLLTRLLKEPPEVRSRLKSIVNLLDIKNVGIAYEVLQWEKLSLDLLAFLDLSKIGIGIAYDLEKINADIGIGVTKPLKDFMNSELKAALYIGIHF